jgi:zinc transporter 1
MSSSVIYGSVALLTLVYSVYEIYTALSLDSLTLLSDGFHNLSDVLALLIGWQCERLSARSSRTVMSYGWSRAELVGALLNGSALLSLCVYVALELIPRVLRPPPIDAARYGLQFMLVASAGLAVNLLGTLIFFCTGTKSFHAHSHAHGHGHAHHAAAAHGSDEHLSLSECAGHSHAHAGHAHAAADGDDDVPAVHSSSSSSKRAASELRIDAVDLLPSRGGARRRKAKAPRRQWNANRYAVFLHFLGDALSSLGVLITGLILHFNADAGWAAYADSVTSALIVVFLLVTTTPLVRRTAVILMQMVPAELDIVRIGAQLRAASPSVVAVPALHVWRLDADTVVATAHVVVAADVFASAALQTDVRLRLTRVLRDSGVHNSTVELQGDSDTAAALLVSRSPAASADSSSSSIVGLSPPSARAVS